MSDPRDVTGVWYGSWGADSRGVRPNSFIALFEEFGGAVSGSISEPDLHGEMTLHAIVAGHRAGGTIEWIKQYDGAGRLAHAVTYAGQVNADATEISGEWRLPRHSGAFRMTREKFTEEELEAEEEAEIREPLLR
jgi:hypothetical protein